MPFQVHNQEMSVKRPKKNPGPYICDHHNCGKEFSRPDHLKRHKANHSARRFKCDDSSCNRLFTRIDVKRKHEQRNHPRLNLKNGLEPGFEHGQVQGLKSESEGEILQAATNENTSESPDAFSTDYPKFEDDPQEVRDFSSQIIKWLLDSTEISPSSSMPTDQMINGALHQAQEDQFGLNSAQLLEEVLALSPEFPTENLHTEIDQKLRFDMIGYIPVLEKHPDFTIPKIKWFLEIYWLLYHCQYPLLHRPSFSTLETHPLLLLSMIMIGASFAKKTQVPAYLNLVDPSDLSLAIAEPLRWAVFASEYSKPPCKVWVIQTLIILETFEVACSSRAIHERACIYNNVKIQLLRRSPILGGDPMKAVASDNSRSNVLWNSWIESESIKRAALMSFNLDTIHAVVFGHPVSLFANQLKLSLPCPDDIWEYRNIDKNKTPLSVTETPLFVDALRLLLKNETVEVDSFGRHILLSGLINLVLQIEQNISQWSNFGWHTFEENWREVLSFAIEFWKSQLPENDCCLTLSSVHYIGATSPPLPLSLLPEDTRCKFPVYHAVQIYLKIPHYDYIVFAGAPKRMNVPILEEDFEIVVRRIERWSSSVNGQLAVINSLLLLCEMLLSSENSLDTINYCYEPVKDPLIYRPNIVISSVLILWSYTFHKFGPESNFLAGFNEESYEPSFIPAVEDGYAFLRRVRDELSTSSGISFSELSKLDINKKNRKMRQCCSILDKIDGLNNTVGLLRCLANEYKKCDWHVGREYAKLMNNCIRRSAGSPQIFCPDMYDVKE